jgi:hypothetical protein
MAPLPYCATALQYHCPFFPSRPQSISLRSMATRCTNQHSHNAQTGANCCVCQHSGIGVAERSSRGYVASRMTLGNYVQQSATHRGSRCNMRLYLNSTGGQGSPALHVALASAAGHVPRRAGRSSVPGRPFGSSGRHRWDIPTELLEVR